VYVAVLAQPARDIGEIWGRYGGDMGEISAVYVAVLAQPARDQG
jgi:hypothetical protein